ncbi:glycoside hydrolase family 73 [Cellvibrio zantedeschiae]|uniref:Glycoside hydrolase family 73 n=1 Tax=Cellvibrio zantedeschiae TaxID=1237077 RepID=A0ABQ3BEL1_9GAMM|nr:glucosaminidase domain-containing protein [Cellvibrio zantedeschiae]GGY87395.1 glycoside hydrolase family 73 [Cellvibrio zantedeschiae]
MQQSFSKWFLGLALIAYAIGTLILVFLLSLNPLSGKIDSDVLTSNTLLPDLTLINQPMERVQLFIGIMRPLVEQKNELLISTRERLLQIKSEVDQKHELGFVDREQLNRLREDFSVSVEDYPSDKQAVEVLLSRVDIIPPAMVIAQAAIESGWGTSFFAQEGNNLFGEWCFKKGCGIVPTRRAASAKHEVRRFDSIEDSINSYYRNINTNNAYRSLRDLRAKIRHDKNKFTGHALVAGLGKYCGRGDIYITEVRSLINHTNLE